MKPTEKKSLTQLLIAFLFSTALPVAAANAGDTSPYLIGHWKLNDVFADFKSVATSPITTQNTEFVFLNPTLDNLNLEYAFFASNGRFCGCHRDVLDGNGRVRSTMLGEKQGGHFSTKLCPTQTDGTMKAIVFQGSPSDNTVFIGDALQAGYPIDLFEGHGRTEAPLLAVPITTATTDEINLAIHDDCLVFIQHP